MRPKKHRETFARLRVPLRTGPNDEPFVGPPLKSFGVFNPSRSLIYYKGLFYNALMLRPSSAVFGELAWMIDPAKRIKRRTIRTRPRYVNG